jgi:NADPH:quinone reductase
LIGNALRFLADGLKTGQIKSRVAELLPLSRAAGAHRRLESREVRGVIVPDPNIES